MLNRTPACVLECAIMSASAFRLRLAYAFCTSTAESRLLLLLP